MCRYWELGAFRFSLGEGRGCSGLFLSCFFLPSSFSSEAWSLIFPFETLSGEHQACLTEVASLSFSSGGVVGKGGGL